LVAAQKDGEKVKFGLVKSWISEDGVIDDVKIASDVAEIMRKFATVNLGYDRWTTGSIGSRLASARFNVVDVSGANFAQACDETLTGLNSGRLQHTGNDTLTAHFMACVKKPSPAGGWRVIRKDSHTSISAAVASIIAVHHASEPAQEISFAY
jgi:phage terminase large subunit-like protein